MIRKLTAALAALSVLALAAAPAPAAAQNVDTLYACYIPNTGNVYRIRTPDTPASCHGNHVEFSWLDNELNAGDGFLLRLKSGSPLTDRFTVDTAGGVVARGQLGIGFEPASGPGYRMVWYPFKSGFRAGAAVGNSWDDANFGFFSWAGGQGTIASGFVSFAFGDGTRATGVGAAAFGSNTNVGGTVGFSAGANNSCGGFACTALGYTVRADGQGSVALGYRSTANANYAVSIGQRATAAGHSGAFTFADASTTDSIQATANNQVSFRGAGGFRFRTSPDLSTGCDLAAGSGVFTCSSSRYLKENFATVDGEDVLGRMRAVPVTTWNYIAEGDEARHLGPFAQDFRAAFGLGTDDTSIGLLDIDGVNFAAAKALEARTARLRAEVDALRADRDDLARRLAELEVLVKAKQ
ncbi:MAG TPA: tail fiber domain-containing protein [Longimicrobium sp.]|nr:tail fiber domain-containing protein [Longimicrobium sp.]